MRKRIFSFLIITCSVIMMYGCKDSVKSNCEIVGKFDSGKYSKNASWIINIEVIDGGNTRKEQHVFTTEEAVSFDLDIKTGTFATADVSFIYKDQEKSWRKSMKLYLNGSEQLNLEIKAIDQGLHIDEDKIGDDNCLLLKSFESALNTKLSYLSQNLPEAERAKESFESILIYGKSFVNVNSQMHSHLKDYMIFRTQADYLMLHFEIPRIYEYRKGVRFKYPEKYFNFKVEPFNVFNKPFCSLYNKSAFLIIKCINEHDEIKEMRGFDALRKKIDVIESEYSNGVCKEQVFRIMLSNFLRSYKYSNTYDEDLKSFTQLVQLLSDQDVKDGLIKGFNNIRYTQPGSPIPELTLKDKEGRDVKLTDLFSNKIVYIDLWASWCRPCCAEIPHLKKLEEAYKDTNIQFISISCDKNGEAWQKALKKYNFHGIQLRDTNGEFLKYLNISGIPRFVLYNSEGKLLNSDAPRPSDPQLKAFFEQYL